MKIILIPQRRDDTLTLSKSGYVLTINGKLFDFSSFVEGTPLLRYDVALYWLTSDMERVNGELRLSLILSHTGNATEKSLFPAPLKIAEDGPVALPPYARACVQDNAVTG